MLYPAEISAWIFGTSGIVLVRKRNRLGGLVLLATAAWILWGIANAHAACSDVHGYWTIAAEGPGEHNSGGDYVELKRSPMAPGYDFMELALHLDPNASWAGCSLGINYTLTGTITMTQAIGSPIAVIYGPNGQEEDCHWAGTPCSKHPVWFGKIMGYTPDFKWGAWINGTTNAVIYAGLASQWIIAPQRMAPHLKRNTQTLRDGLNTAGDATALVAPALPNAMARTVVALAAGIMKNTASRLDDVLNEDPWDNARQTIYSATVTEVPAYITNGLYQDWIRNLYRIQARIEELFQALERANTCMALGEPCQSDQQGRVDNRIAKLIELCETEANLRVRVAAKVTEAATQIADPALMAALRGLG